MTENSSGPSALRWICVVVGVMLAWSGIQMAMIAIGNFRPQMALAHSHVTADATVLGVRWEKHDMGRKKGTGVASTSLQDNDFVNVCYVRFHFVADGHDVEGEIEPAGFGASDPAAPPYHTGDVIRVMYRPGHPDHAVLNVSSSIWGPIIAPGAVALLLFIFAGALFYGFRLMSRKVNGAGAGSVSPNAKPPVMGGSETHSMNLSPGTKLGPYEIVLETDRLLFRDHQLDDLEPFCAIEADAEFRRFVGGQPRTRAAAEEKFRHKYLPAIRNRMALWATIYKPEGCYIGYCGVYPHFGSAGPIPGEGTLAFYLASPYWKKGLATEAGLAFVRFAFGELNLSRLVASVQTGNDASVHVLTKLGFVGVEHEDGARRSFDHFELRNPEATTPPAA
jgi:ribosomal-protein-alanine N-acetyltransferase